MLYKHFLQTAGAGKFRVHRVLEQESAPYLARLLKDGTPKYKEVSFAEWWASLSSGDRAVLLIEAPEGAFIDRTIPFDEGHMLCSLETGEPVDASDYIGAIPDATIITTDAPADLDVESTEVTEMPLPSAPQTTTEDVKPKARKARAPKTSK
jgi:hypothetical protein